MERITMAQLHDYIASGRRYKLMSSSPTFEHGNTIVICFSATRAAVSTELKSITLLDANGNRAALHCIDDIALRCCDSTKVLLDVICNDLDKLYRYRLTIYR